MVDVPSKRPRSMLLNMSQKLGHVHFARHAQKSRQFFVPIFGTRFGKCRSCALYLCPSNNFRERRRHAGKLFFSYVPNMSPIFSAFRQRVPTRLMLTFNGSLPQIGQRSTNLSRKPASERSLGTQTTPVLFIVIFEKNSSYSLFPPKYLRTIHV